MRLGWDRGEKRTVVGGGRCGCCWLLLACCLVGRKALRVEGVRRREGGRRCRGSCVGAVLRLRE